MASACFGVVPANTPERQASLNAVPRHQFVRRVRNNQIVFACAEPTVCDFPYIGNQVAYDRFCREMHVRNIVMQQVTAQISYIETGTWALAGSEHAVARLPREKKSRRQDGSQQGLTTRI